MKIALYMSDKTSCKFCDQETLDRFMATAGTRLLWRFLQDNAVGMSYEELWQEMLIATSRALASYDTARMDTKLTTYVWACWNNALRMIRRKKSSLKETSAEALTVSIEEAVEEEDDDLVAKLEENIETQRKLDLIHKVIDDPDAGLTEVEKKVIKLTIQGHNQKEIGENVGWSQSHISRLYNSAVDKIRLAIGTENGALPAREKSPKSENPAAAKEKPRQKLVWQQQSEYFWDIISDPKMELSEEAIRLFSLMREGRSLYSAGWMLGLGYGNTTRIYNDTIRKVQEACEPM